MIFCNVYLQRTLHIDYCFLMLSILTTVVLFRNLGGFSFCFVQLADFFLYIYINKINTAGASLALFPSKKIISNLQQGFYFTWFSRICELD
jgi:hypothetical protein